MANKKQDDLEIFLQQQVNIPDESTVKEKIEVVKPKAENLINKAIEESSVGGRPLKQEEEKATKRLICYVNSEKKNNFTEKRGPISESKLLGLLVDKYLNGEITL